MLGGATAGYPASEENNAVKLNNCLLDTPLLHISVQKDLNGRKKSRTSPALSAVHTSGLSKLIL